MRPAFLAATALAALLGCTSAGAAVPFRFGTFPAGRLDGITDVPGVMVANVTKIEGASIRTGATAIFPTADPWNHKVSAAAIAFNGNGAMTNTDWVNESGYLETPIVFTDTLDVGRAYDGVIGWMMHRYPQIGRTDDVPLPVVAECDDGLLNDIRARAVTAADVERLLSEVRPGQFARGGVGAGTGMIAFGFKGGIGSASRVLPANEGGYTVGVLVNDNTSSGSTRDQLMIDGVHVGQALANEYRVKFPHKVALHGRMGEGSIVIAVATNAPLDSRQLRAVAYRAALGMARTGLYSSQGSGDLFIAFSTGRVFNRNKDYDILPPSTEILTGGRTINALYLATVEATEGAIYDALFHGKTMVGRGGVTVYGLPTARVLQMLQRAGVR
jgi:D-aminopeptidase